MGRFLRKIKRQVRRATKADNQRARDLFEENKRKETSNANAYWFVHVRDFTTFHVPN